MSEKILTKAIPQLLRPIKMGGRKLKPALVHEDLWHGWWGLTTRLASQCCTTVAPFTAITSVCRKLPFSGLYGRWNNTDDFPMWRSARYQTNQPHIRAYFRIPEINAGVEDLEDHNAPYAAWVSLHTIFPRP